MKRILLIATIQGIFVPSDTIGGVIWSKNLGTFVPIFSVEPYSSLQRELFLKQREAETHNFQGHVVRISYFQKDSMIDFKENDTKISGVVGDIWNLLAISLNFTLKPIRSKQLTTGSHINQSYYGLLGELQRNETDVIPRVEMFSVRYMAGDFTPALWTTLYVMIKYEIYRKITTSEYTPVEAIPLLSQTFFATNNNSDVNQDITIRQRLYVQPEYTHKHDWMLHLFSWKVWYAIILTYCVLSICSYASQAIFCYIFEIKEKGYFADHCFYSFAMLCKEGCIPDDFNGKSRILEFTLGLFTSIIHISFSALIFNYMTNTVYILPFEDLETLVKYTTYDVVNVNGSISHLAFSTGQPVFKDVVKAKRVITTPTDNEMYEKVCSKKKKHALFTAADLFETANINMCKLRAVGKPYYATWIASSINRGFKYKRTIDIGIIKLHEFGFVSRLKAQVKARHTQGAEFKSPAPIDMSQVSLIFVMLSSASVLASIIFVFENLIYVWNCGKIRTISKNKIQRM